MENSANQNLERQKFETSSADCRIVRRWSDIDSYAAPLMCQTYITQLFKICYSIRLAILYKNRLICFEFYLDFAGECAPTLSITYSIRRLNHASI
jgi:hypothetical protein